MDGKRWNGYLYEDLYLGMEFLSPGRTITDADLVGFAGLTGDFSELHTSDVYAQNSQFVGRGSGGHGAGIVRGPLHVVGGRLNLAHDRLAALRSLCLPVRVLVGVFLQAPHVVSQKEQEQTKDVPKRGSVRRTPCRTSSGPHPRASGSGNRTAPAAPRYRRDLAARRWHASARP